MTKPITISADEFPADQHDALVDAERKLAIAINALNTLGGAFTDAAIAMPPKTAFATDMNATAVKAWELHTDAQRLYTRFGEVITRQSNRQHA